MTRVHYRRVISDRKDPGFNVVRSKPQSMKIAFLTRSLAFGGAERQLVNLAIGLKQIGHEVTVIAMYGGGELSDDLRSGGVVLRTLSKSSRWDLFGFIARLARTIRTERPDILHGYLPVPNMLTVLLRPLSGPYRKVWGVRAAARNLNSYDWFVRLTSRLESTFSRFADLIIINSKAGRDFAVSRGFPAERCVVIPNGIDTERFKPLATERITLRQQIGIPHDSELVGLVGRLDPVKGIEDFLKAAAAAHKRRPSLRFIVVGDGPTDYLEQLKQVSAELGVAESLTWSPARSDLPSLYSSLDLLVSSSHSEGFSNVIAEGMSCGTPCIVTDVGDSSWIVGDSGVVVPAGDAGAMADAVAHFFDADTSAARAELSLGARARIKEKFSLQSLAASTDAALRASR